MPASAGKAQLFTDVGYGGASATLDVGTYNLGENTASVHDDTVSSLKVTSGYQVTVYTGRGWSGEDHVFTTDQPRLAGNLNDTASSVRVERRPDPDGGQQLVFGQPPSYHQ